MFREFRLRRLPVFVLLFALCSCVTTQPDLSKGLNQQKAYVIVGREAVAHGWKDYFDYNDTLESQVSSEVIRGMPSGREMIFRKYNSDGKLSDVKYPVNDNETFIVDLNLSPFPFRNSLQSIVFGGGGRGVDISEITDKFHGKSAQVFGEGYLVYDVFEVTPGNWVFERYRYDKFGCINPRGCGNTLYNVMQLKRGQVSQNSLGFSVSAGELVYVADAKIEFDIVSKNVMNKNYSFKNSNMPVDEVRTYHYAKNIKFSFGLDVSRMKEAMSSRLDVSRVVVRKLRRIK